MRRVWEAGSQAAWLASRLKQKSGDRQTKRGRLGLKYALLRARMPPPRPRGPQTGRWTYLGQEPTCRPALVVVADIDLHQLPQIRSIEHELVFSSPFKVVLLIFQPTLPCIHTRARNLQSRLEEEEKTRF